MDSLDDLDFEELDDVERSCLSRSAVTRETTRFRGPGEAEAGEATVMAGFAKLTGEAVIAGGGGAFSSAFLSGMAF